MSMTENGVTTTNTAGQEQYEPFKMNGKQFIQYDYRHTDGELFSCVKRTLELCRDSRDIWLRRK